jgi:hypothetical protein
MKRTQKDRDEDLALGRELERKDAEIERLRAALRDVLAVEYAEECQECGIGRKEAWLRAKALSQQQGGTK